MSLGPSSPDPQKIGIVLVVLDASRCAPGSTRRDLPLIAALQTVPAQRWCHVVNLRFDGCSCSLYDGADCLARIPEPLAQTCHYVASSDLFSDSKGCSRQMILLVRMVAMCIVVESLAVVLPVAAQSLCASLAR